jgi:hypothetical protein
MLMTGGRTRTLMVAGDGASGVGRRGANVIGDGEGAIGLVGGADWDSDRGLGWQ